MVHLAKPANWLVRARQHDARSASNLLLEVEEVSSVESAGSNDISKVQHIVGNPKLTSFFVCNFCIVAVSLACQLTHVETALQGLAWEARRANHGRKQPPSGDLAA